MTSDALPEITEVKRTLAGVEKIFRCRVLARGPAPEADAVVLFVSDRAYRVAELDLPAGTVTFGHFWRDRPYNVYHWMTPAGATRALYLNLADATDVAGDVLRWRDLAVDLLLTPDGRTQVLDEDEVPADTGPDDRARIAAARARALADADRLRVEIESAAVLLWPRAFAGARRP